MRSSFLIAAAVILAVVPAAHAAIAKDQVMGLPGWAGALPSKQYSGVLPANSDGTRFLHYWFVESENDPATDPVVLWMNGGPGCSSLEGYFYEQGPFHINSTMGLEQNPWRWNRMANMIFLEAPAGVGFSYCTEESACATNDNQTASDNFYFLTQWFKGFSEYSSNDFYITGESYAGVYVPTLALQVQAHPSAGINLKGFMVGNGCVGDKVGSCSQQGTEILVKFLIAHGLFSQPLYAKMQKECTDYANPSSSCQQLLTQMGTEVGKIDIYDIYGNCTNSGVRSRLSPLLRGSSVDERIFRASTVPLPATMVGGPDECIDGGAASTYLNRKEVQEAIHVSRVGTGSKWSVCSNINYTPSIDSLVGAYPGLFKDYKVVVYSGDSDACVPYSGTEEWINSLNLPVKSPWRSWLVGNQVAGYVTEYNDNFFFVTVKGSGHMVPQYKPAQAFAMVSRYLSGQPF